MKREMDFYSNEGYISDDTCPQSGTYNFKEAFRFFFSDESKFFKATVDENPLEEVKKRFIIGTKYLFTANAAFLDYVYGTLNKKFEEMKSKFKGYSSFKDEVHKNIIHKSLEKTKQFILSEIVKYKGSIRIINAIDSLFNETFLHKDGTPCIGDKEYPMITKSFSVYKKIFSKERPTLKEEDFPGKDSEIESTIKQINKNGIRKFINFSKVKDFLKSRKSRNIKVIMGRYIFYVFCEVLVEECITFFRENSKFPRISEDFIKTFKIKKANDILLLIRFFNLQENRRIFYLNFTDERDYTWAHRASFDYEVKYDDESTFSAIVADDFSMGKSNISRQNLVQDLGSYDAIIKSVEEKKMDLSLIVSEKIQKSLGRDSVDYIFKLKHLFLFTEPMRFPASYIISMVSLSLLRSKKVDLYSLFKKRNPLYSPSIKGFVSSVRFFLKEFMHHMPFPYVYFGKTEDGAPFFKFDKSILKKDSQNISQYESILDIKTKDKKDKPPKYVIRAILAESSYVLFNKYFEPSSINVPSIDSSESFWEKIFLDFKEKMRTSIF